MVLLITAKALPLAAWGFLSHKIINEQAIYGLPFEMFGLYKSNLHYFIAHAPSPDKRRYMVKDEGAKHYIDLDYYLKLMPFDSIPREWDKAVLQFGDSALLSHGMAPWNLQWMYYRLTMAFLHTDYTQIIKISNDMGHYVGDIHVPLHTTSNYNGQKTGQHGIHGLWETRIPTLFSSQFDYTPQRASYLNKPSDAIWEAVRESFYWVDTVLMMEKILSDTFPPHLKFQFIENGGQMIKTYSETYSHHYQLLMGNMVEMRMQSAIHLLSNLWFSAWVDAGQPPLSTHVLSAKKRKKKEKKPPLPSAIMGRPEPNDDP
jgi:hypothetical protein